jgi:HEAT repeat protein
VPLIRKGEPEAPKAVLARDPVVALTSGTADERWLAARSLGALDADVDHLAEALAREPEPWVREALFTSLARAGTPRSVDAILPWLKCDDADRRTGALDALRSLPRIDTSLLTRLLADPDPDVRLLTCELARALPAGQATQLMCDLLDQEREVNVCAAAVEVLAEIGEPRAAPALQRCAARFADERFLNFAIEAALEQVIQHRG